MKLKSIKKKFIFYKNNLKGHFTVNLEHGNSKTKLLDCHHKTIVT